MELSEPVLHAYDIRVFLLLRQALLLRSQLQVHRILSVHMQQVLRYL